MATGQWGVVLRHVQRLFQGEGLAGLSEGQLLDRFATTRDEAAFGALLALHGPMVLGVCRGTLDDPLDVDDAFQATFLILVKKAGALRDGDRLGQWLHGVARRVALRARSDASRRRAREGAGAGVEAVADPRATLDAEFRELQSLIREEVDRLSDHDRMAVVLCYLEGLTHEEAADRLGWPVGTVKGRLSRAREKLRDRLTRRGVALPAVAIGATLAEGASAAVPLELIRSTTLAATRLAAGQALTAGIVSARALNLMEGVIGTMFATKLKLGAMALIAAGASAASGVLAFQEQKPTAEVGKSSVEVSKSASPPAQEAPTSMLIEPGTEDARERETIVVFAEKALKTLEELMGKDPAALSIEGYYAWSRRLAEAKAGPKASEAGRKSALQEHVDRMRKLNQIVRRQRSEGRRSDLDAMEAQYRRIEADRWLRQGRIDAVAENRAAAPELDKAFGPGPGPRPLAIKTLPGDEKRDQAILAKLELPIAMSFGRDTPLSDVLKYVKDATQDEAAGLPTGIPIYVDPVGLQDADKTMANTVAIQLEGIPLRTTLRLLLHQLSLTYRVEGGLLYITNEDATVGGPIPFQPLGGGSGSGFR